VGYRWEYLEPYPGAPGGRGTQRRVVCAGFEPAAEHPLHETIEEAACCDSPVRFYPGARVTPYPHRCLRWQKEVAYFLTDEEDARLQECLRQGNRFPSGPG